MIEERYKDLLRRYQDLLEIARLVSWCSDRDYLIRTCLDHLSVKLRKRARCVLVEGHDLKLHCWVGTYDSPMDQVRVSRQSIVREVFEKGVPLNLTDPHQTNGYEHTLTEKVKIKAVVPLIYVDPMTQQEKKVGVLIVDSGHQGVPISEDDFEYLKVVSELIGAAAGKAELVEQLKESYRKMEVAVRETTHNFRNRITVIGGFSHRILQLAKETALDEVARSIYREVQVLESNLEQFEKYLASDGHMLGPGSDQPGHSG